MAALQGSWASFPREALVQLHPQRERREGQAAGSTLVLSRDFWVGQGDGGIWFLRCRDRKGSQAFCQFLFGPLFWPGF